MCQSVHSTNTLPLGCICVRCIYIWPEGEGWRERERAGLVRWLVHPPVRACLSLSLCVRVCTCRERVSGSGGFIIRHCPRRVNPGQCVVKKPCARSASLPTRSVFEAGRGPRDEEGRQGGNEGESARAGEREEGRQMCTHAHTRASEMHSRRPSSVAKLRLRLRSRSNECVLHAWI